MRKFKTESKKLLDLMINSIYTNREIFLRELISNASDAIDKLYLKSLTDASAKVDQENLAITLAYDKDARTLTVSDNGIGMTADELEKNLGTSSNVAWTRWLSSASARSMAARTSVSVQTVSVVSAASTAVHTSAHASKASGETAADTILTSGIAM